MGIFNIKMTFVCLRDISRLPSHEGYSGPQICYLNDKNDKKSQL